MAEALRGDSIVASPFAGPLQSCVEQLPPTFRDQYLLPVDAEYDIVLGGQMQRLWHRPRWLWPVFWLLAKADIFFPETGENIPTTLVISASRDQKGEPIHTWQRTFFFPHRHRRRFTSLMVYDRRRGRVVELQGPGDRFEEVADVRFIPPATLEFVTIESAVRLGRRRLRLPRRLWMTARVVQRADAEHEDTSHVTLTITHAFLGPIFGYEGTFRTRRRMRNPREN